MPGGFLANGVACGIKKSGKLDLALFYSQGKAKAAAMFTTNKILAAHIKIDKLYMKKNNGYYAVLVNSGNANCFTGKEGVKDAEATTSNVAGNLKVQKEEVLVASTGIIGKRISVEKINKALPGLVQGLSRPGINRAKRAILTTDKQVKEITVRFPLGKQEVTLCGIAKGAGMIAPDMATMLVFLFTDARITQGALRSALKIAVENSFNCITVDGCMSTNDTVLILANGQAQNTLIDTKQNFKVFLEALKSVTEELAKMIVHGAEGATKFIRITVNEARDFHEAKRAALYIANSNLFKTAIYGENPNFGRIAAAVGASKIQTKEEDLKIGVSPLNKKEIDVEVWLKRGKACARVYTSDLTPEYIKINAAYN